SRGRRQTAPLLYQRPRYDSCVLPGRADRAATAGVVTGFQEVRLAAMQAGALGCSISGAGPTLLAWALAKDAHRALEAMRREFATAAIRIDEWLMEFRADGAHVIESG